MSKKPDWLFRQSAAIPIFDNKVVLITSRKSKQWTIPKGVVEKSMTPWDSASLEAREEAGVLGVIESHKLGTYRYSKWGGECTVLVYRLHVECLLENWDEMDFRDRIVEYPENAIRKLTNNALKELTLKAFS